MPKGNYRNYEKQDMLRAAQMVREEGVSIYKASKDMNIAWTSLKRYLSKTENADGNQVIHDLPKLGRPFALPADLEVRIFNYIIAMQELGFGLTVQNIRKLAFSVAKSVDRGHFFMEDNEIASKWWWTNFKKRYGLTLRVPENLAAYRASMANPTMLADFYTKLEALVTKLGIKDTPGRIWNCDETGLSFVVKPNKVVTALGKRYVYKRSYADRGETTTVLGCICDNGSYIPPLVIFKGVRWNPDLARGAIPNSLVKLSPKGWINSDIFLEWFQFFINSVPKERPIILLMDSHASHLSLAVLELAKQNNIHLFTFPAHTSHLLQPLDVGVYRPLKSAWTNCLNDYMKEKNGEKPSRYNFNEIFSVAMIKSFSPVNIEHAFRKSGICPLNKDAISPEAIAPSKLTETVLHDQSVNRSGDIVPSDPSLEASTVDNLFLLPSASSATKVNPRAKTRDSSAKWLTDPALSAEPQPGASGVVSSKAANAKKSALKGKTKTKGKKKDDDWHCGVCGMSYREDEKAKNGALWIQCSFCCVPYHTNCQTRPDDDDIFMCDGCASDDSE